MYTQQSLAKTLRHIEYIGRSEGLALSGWGCTRPLYSWSALFVSMYSECRCFVATACITILGRQKVGGSDVTQEMDL